MGADTVVTYFIAFSEHLTKDGGITVAVPVVYTGTIGNAVPHAGDPQTFAGGLGRSGEGQKKAGEQNQHRRYAKFQKFCTVHGIGRLPRYWGAQGEYKINSLILKDIVQNYLQIKN